MVNSTACLIVKRNPRERGLLVVNCRKTGTGQSLAGLAEYTCVFILFTFIFELKEATTQHNFLLSWVTKVSGLHSTAYYFDAWIIVLMFDWVCPSRPRDVCTSSSDPSRGPSEYDGGHLVHTVLAKQEELLRQLVYSIILYCLSARAYYYMNSYHLTIILLSSPHSFEPH